MANSHGSTTRTKHTEIRHHFLVAEVHADKQRAVYIPSNLWKADLLTKSLAKPKYWPTFPSSINSSEVPTPGRASGARAANQYQDSILTNAHFHSGIRL